MSQQANDHLIQDENINSYTSAENEIIVSSESSEDENESQSLFARLQNSALVHSSIKDLINKAKLLLVHADIKSRPEPYKSEAVSTYQYSFSSSVNASDLLRESEIKELLDLISTLKFRLSAERVFSLGCPQHSKEKKIYDELVMLYSDELLDTWRNTTDRDSVDDRTLTLHGVSSQNSRRHPPLCDYNGPSTSRQDHHHNEFHISEIAFANLEKETEGLSKEECSLIKNIGGFLKGVKKFCSLTSLDPKIISEMSKASSLWDVLNSIHNSLTAALNLRIEDNISESSSPSYKKRKRSKEDKSCEELKKSKSEDCIADENKASYEDEESCSVCLEPWTTGGDHRVTCLKCGHLFGLSCIVKWIEQSHCCPQCKAAAKKSDLRPIFVTRITAEDTSEKDRALKLLEEEKLMRRQLQQKEVQARLALEAQIAENELLRMELLQLRSLAPAGPSAALITMPKPIQPSCSQASSSSNKRFHMFSKINIGQEANCRVFDYSKELQMLVVSQKSTNALFRGFGIKMFSREFKPLCYQPLHSAQIRDMCFRPGCYDGQLLSCGLDKCIQLTSMTSKVVIQKYNVSSAVWCCAWNTGDTNLFYAGMEKGVVREFDIRRTDSHIQDIMDYGGSPVSSIHYYNSGSGDSFQGLLVAQSQKLIFQMKEADRFTTHLLHPMSATVMSLSLHSNGHFLSSFRPGANQPNCKYEVHSLIHGVGNNAVTSSRKSAWDGSNMQVIISRNALISQPESASELFAITANHSKNLVSIWDVKKKQEFQSLPCYDRAIDIKGIANQNGDLLAVLTEKDMVLYKWRD